MTTTNSLPSLYPTVTADTWSRQLGQTKGCGFSAAGSVLVCLLIAELVTVIESTVYDVAEHTRRSDRHTSGRTTKLTASYNRLTNRNS